MPTPSTDARRSWQKLISLIEFRQLYVVKKQQLQVPLTHAPAFEAHQVTAAEVFFIV